MKWKKRTDMVYSTNPDFQYSEEKKEEADTPPPEQQKLKVSLETKGRRGKTITLISGFTGKEADLCLLGNKLKTACGTGGTVKNGSILLQGDKRARAISLLQKEGYHTGQKGS